MLKITKTNTGATFKVRVQPGAAKNEIIGVQKDAFKVRITAPPVKGKANKALINFLAKELGVKKSEIEIISGHTSRVKTIKVVGEGSKHYQKMQQAVLNIHKLREKAGDWDGVAEIRKWREAR